MARQVPPWSIDLEAALAGKLPSWYRQPQSACMLLRVLSSALLVFPLATESQSPTPAQPAPSRAIHQPQPMRSLSELTATDDPAWPLVQQWLAAAPNAVVLPVTPSKAEAALTHLQVTLRSPMGAVTYYTGGILVDHGWLRILGSGSTQLARSIPSWNAGRAPTDASGNSAFLLVADDVLGGFFAINGGGLAGKPGNVFYLAPDSLEWEDLSVGYTDFLHWALSPRVEAFYADTRWPHWQDEVAMVPGDKALSVYPFLWAEGPSIEHRSRRAVPVEEIYGVTMDARRQIGGAGAQ